MLKDPAVHQSIRNPALSASMAPIIGPIVCATDHAMVYKPAYCPLFSGTVLLIQKEFMNGIEKISPKVIRRIISMDKE